MKSIDQLVTFRTGEEDYGIPITEVYEIIFVPKITPVAKSPQSMVGVINLRGTIIPVISLRTVLGKDEMEPSKKQRVIVTGAQGSVVGLLVDAVTEVLRVRQEQFEPAPLALSNEQNAYFQFMYKLEDRIIALLEMERLLSREEQTFIQAV